MRKMTFMACAALLTSMIALNSCKSDQNDPQKQVDGVKTEFNIAIPAQAASGPRRMPSANVPETGTFVGMKHIALIPFAKKTTPSTPSVVRGDARLGGANIAGIEDIAADGLTTNGKAKRYDSITIPLTTAYFLVYAEATAAAATDGTDSQKHQGGVLNAAGISDGATNGISFDLVPVLPGLDNVYAGDTAVALLALLNAVANAEDGAGTPKAWKNYTSGDDATMVALFETYKTMHGLSSFEVKRALEDLYKTTELLKASAVAPVITLIANIQAAIETGITVTREGGSGAVTGFAWNANYDGYPANWNIPDGSVRIKYDEGAFVKCEAGDYGSSTHTNPALLTYPASLWYYGNSTIATAYKSMKNSLDNKTWEAVMTDYAAELKPAEVNSQTRSVAIVNPIQYAVGRFDVFVKLAATSLEDHAGETVTANASGFPLSAIFIGNQRRALFDFTPDTINTPTKYTIYDNAMRGGTPYNVTDAAFTETPANSTFVLETPSNIGRSDDGAEADVQIAIELTNNTKSDFIGANGQVIPKNGKFYLVAKLSSAAATETEQRVFKQDFLTKAKLTITSLAGAYNEIPDLRVPQVELGMSVDLTWQSGHTYSIDL